MQELRVGLSPETLTCTACGKRTHTAPSEAALLFCNGECQRDLPEYHFPAGMLADWQATDMLISAKCARCVVKERHADETEQFQCQTCTQTKHVTAFSPAELKRWLAGRPNAYNWSCYDLSLIHI